MSNLTAVPAEWQAGLYESMLRADQANEQIREAQRRVRERVENSRSVPPGRVDRWFRRKEILSKDPDFLDGIDDYRFYASEVQRYAAAIQAHIALSRS